MDNKEKCKRSYYFGVGVGILMGILGLASISLIFIQLNYENINNALIFSSAIMALFGFGYCMFGCNKYKGVGK